MGIERDPETVALIPESTARRYCVLATSKKDNRITVAMADPFDVRAIDAVRVETGCAIDKTVSERTAIQRAVDHYYLNPSRLADSLKALLSAKTPTNGDHSPAAVRASSSTPDELDQLKLEASDAPVVQFVNLILMRAVQDRASDIHVEPEENSINVRFRVDGALRDFSSPPKHLQQAILTRIKLLSDLNIAEHRLPQDGRFKFRAFQKTIDVRVSCLPTIHGEKLVLRILDRSSLILDMEELGFEPELQRTFLRVLDLPYGLVILTGPTGSGKTTTLYAALRMIAKRTKNIVTIEDPVEYQLKGINQVRVRSDIGFSFANGLRAILRQDPDIIMVGEIRDRETAEICIRAALTGHLVLSTLHTNDSASAISRLTDMGVEPYLLAATINLLIAQRLVRRICPDCREKWTPSDELIERLGRLAPLDSKSWEFHKGRGCASCGDTGYRGRIAVYEPFLVTGEIRTLIAEGAALRTLKETAFRGGVRSLLHAALKKVKEGMTTLDEALSICATQTEPMQSEE